MKDHFTCPMCSRCIETVTIATGYHNTKLRTKHTNTRCKLSERERKRQTQMVLLGGAEGGMAPQGGGMTGDG